jgi:RNA polymerase sigma-70 factor (ECF subfamily)
VTQQIDFERGVTAAFEAQFPRLFRLLDRLSGDPELAADLAQEAFVRLYRRGSFPEAPDAWLATVALNLFRNSRTTQARRRRLLTPARGAGAHADPAPDPAAGVEADESRTRVRSALERLAGRDRHLLLLSAEGYSYKEMAGILGLAEGSVGTFLARAREAFKEELSYAT